MTVSLMIISKAVKIKKIKNKYLISLQKLNNIIVLKLKSVMKKVVMIKEVLSDKE